LRKNTRDLDRDLLTLDREEKRIQAEIKKLAKANQMGAAKTLAKEVIRIRKQREKIISMKGNWKNQLSLTNHSNQPL
jgi:charged multivesicular body protein 2A